MKYHVEISGVFFFFFQKSVLQTPLLGDFFSNNPIIISYVIVIVQVLTNRCKSKFKTDKYQVCMIWPMIKSTRDHFFYKRFSKLDFPKRC